MRRARSISVTGIRAVNQAVAALAENPEPPDAFVRGGYRWLRVGDYRVLYEAEEDVITIVRVDKVR
jgi:mRNA-degrading endonuclease RelE of RelBE toxin-antitoxin system